MDTASFGQDGTAGQAISGTWRDSVSVCRCFWRLRRSDWGQSVAPGSGHIDFGQNREDAGERAANKSPAGVCDSDVGGRWVIFPEVIRLDGEWRFFSGSE
jgi:hypothetical protein